MKKLITRLLLLVFTTTSVVLAKAPTRTIKVAAPPAGLLALPLLHMVETQPLEDQGMILQFVPWKNSEQLRALVLSQKADVVSMHTVAAATLNSKGVPLKLMGLCLGNVMHILSTNSEINAMNDLKGLTVAVPMKGEIPDILFRAILDQTKNISVKDLTIRYTASSRDAANLLAAGRVDAALIADPHSSILLQKSGKNNIPKLYHSIDLQNAWDAANGTSEPLPVAGIAAIGAFSNDQRAMVAFWRAYAAAVRWCAENPDQAALLHPDGQTASDPAIGIEKAAKRSYIVPVTAKASQASIEQFTALLRRSAPKKYDQTHPKTGFYWAEQ